MLRGQSLTLCILTMSIFIFTSCELVGNPCDLPGAPHCGANGSCVNDGGAAKCSCFGGYTGYTCDTPPCVPDCNGKDCGYDGCVDFCGFCDTGEICIAGLCEICLPDCTGRECGDDGCGDICGICPGVNVCNEEGLCEAPPDPCDGISCGDEGICIEGFCSCPPGYNGPECHNSSVTRVFVTEEYYKGWELGGIAGADAICQGEAEAAGLQGTFKAWLSGQSNSPADESAFYHSQVPYALVDGTEVANNWSDLTDGNLQVPIYLTAKGNQIGGGHHEREVWTNTNVDGTARSTQAEKTCNNWMEEGCSSRAGSGHSTNSDGKWTRAGEHACSSRQGLYCFEQGHESGGTEPWWMLTCLRCHETPPSHISMADWIDYWIDLFCLCH